MNLKEFILKTYVNHIQAICDPEYDSSHLSKKDFIHIENFLIQIENEHFLNLKGYDQLKKYFIFQFDYWISKDLQNDFKIFPIHWILGRKAVDRWNTYPFKDLTKAKGNISQFNVKQTSIQREVCDNILPHEELKRRMFLNEPNGLIYCQEVTTLYHPDSTICPHCNFNEQCQDILLKQIPNLYLKRGLIPKQSKVRRIS